MRHWYLRGSQTKNLSVVLVIEHFKNVFKISQRSKRKYLCWSLFLVRLQVFSLKFYKKKRPGTTLYQKRNSGIGVFSRTLQIFSEVYHRIPPNNCFWRSSGFYYKRFEYLLLIISLRIILKRGSHFTISEIKPGQNSGYFYGNF